MKNALLVIAGLVLAVIVFVVLRSPQGSWMMAFRAPITFYGKVVDQHGMPVADAEVELRPNTGLGKRKSYKQKTDANGDFAVKGLRGLSLYVQVRKEGYHLVPSKDGSPGSEGNYMYTDTGGGVHVPDRNRPVVFSIRKAGILEKLEFQEGDVSLPKSGAPVRVSLHRDEESPMHLVEFSCETRERNEGNSKFDWHFKVTIVEGGLAPREDKFDFEAPVEGYQPGDSVEMRASDPDGVWRDYCKRSYFVRFDDGVHARFEAEMRADGDHFVVLKSCLNPKSGSRNLESPPKE